jgi:hypothetical protein
MKERVLYSQNLTTLYRYYVSMCAAQRLKINIQVNSYPISGAINKQNGCETILRQTVKQIL